MIQLNPSCLVMQTPAGENIPCSAELVTVELMGDAAKFLEPDVVRNIAAAVLHYFKTELGKSSVSVGEFSLALERVLRQFGFNGTLSPKPAPIRTVESDLRRIACASGKGFELTFFTYLRKEMRLKLTQSPELVRFKGLRGCVKQLVGARRWSRQCQKLNDQIVDYLRVCFSAEKKADDCALLVL